MKEYCRNKSACRREVLLKDFESDAADKPHPPKLLSML